MVTRINVGPKVVASDDAIAGPLNIKHSFGRDSATVYPFRNRLRRDPNRPSKVCLRAEGSKNRSEDIFLTGGALRDEDVLMHNVSLIHRQFITVNHHAIDHKPMVDEYGLMTSRIPEPENYAAFAAWVRALSAYAGSQAALARAAGVSPQMITKYLAGRSIEPENLQKFANFSGISYAKLRLLVDGKPISEARDIKDRINQTATPIGAQIGRKWETIRDETTRALLARQIEHALEQEKRMEIASRKKTG